MVIGGLNSQEFEEGGAIIENRSGSFVYEINRGENIFSSLWVWD